MHSEDDLLPISALQHMLFCERQTALIHLERLWVENRFTAEGRLLHKKTDNAKSETRDGIRITRSLPVHSFRLGVFGLCDVVNFKPPSFRSEQTGSLAGWVQLELARVRSTLLSRATMSPVAEARHSGDVVDDRPPFHMWEVTPVEFKRGQPKKNAADRVQLCAQVMCLEEMLGISIPVAELFYGQRQRRTIVEISEQLRLLTQQTADRLHAMVASQRTPSAAREPKCDACSLLAICMPPESGGVVASRYIEKMLRE